MRIIWVWVVVGFPTGEEGIVVDFPGSTWPVPTHFPLLYLWVPVEEGPQSAGRRPTLTQGPPGAPGRHQTSQKM